MSVLIKFGCWTPKLAYIDYYYNGVVTKLIEFAREAGHDRYGRHFDAEALLTFVLEAGITDKSADYMYRHYVYHIINRHDHIDVDEAELEYLYNEFSTLGVKDKN